MNLISRLKNWQTQNWDNRRIANENDVYNYSKDYYGAFGAPVKGYKQNYKYPKAKNIRLAKLFSGGKNVTFKL